MAFITPYDKATMMHVLVNAMFFQKPFGTSAGLPCLSR